MATVITKKIGATNTPTTMDYSSTQAFEDAVTANLVSADEQWIGECYNQGALAACTFSGHTTDATRNIILRCATGAYLGSATRASTALYYNTSYVHLTSGFFSMSDHYTEIEDIQITKTNGTNYGIAMQFGASNIDECKIRRGVWLVHSTFYGIQGGGGNNQFMNMLVVQSSTGPAFAVNSKVTNCTIIDTGGAAAALSTAYDQMVVKNCAIFGFTNIVASGSLGAGTDYNGTDCATFPTGSNNQTSLTFADQFESTTNDFRVKSTGTLDTTGNDLVNTPTGVKYDFWGRDRDAQGDTWSIGCDQFVSAGSTIVIKTFNGLAQASVKTYNGLASASTKTWNGVSNV